MADNKQDDEILGKAYDSKLMKRLLTYIKPYKKYVIIAILLNIFGTPPPAARAVPGEFLK